MMSKRPFRSPHLIHNMSNRNTLPTSPHHPPQIPHLHPWRNQQPTPPPSTPPRQTRHRPPHRRHKILPPQRHVRSQLCRVRSQCLDDGVQEWFYGGSLVECELGEGGYDGGGEDLEGTGGLG